MRQTIKSFCNCCKFIEKGIVQIFEFIPILALNHIVHVPSIAVAELFLVSYYIYKYAWVLDVTVLVRSSWVLEETCS